MDSLITIVIAAFACLAATYVTAESTLFRPVRRWLLINNGQLDSQFHAELIAGRHRRRSAWHRLIAFLTDLLTCHVCQSYWHALVLAAIVHNHVLGGPQGFVFCWLGIAGGYRFLHREKHGAAKSITAFVDDQLS